MKNEYTKEQVDAILEALDEAIETGPWEESNFLRVIGKNLKDIRANFAASLGSNQEMEKLKELTSNQEAKLADKKEVFISLYSTEGSKLIAWERIIANLPRQMISRPIYKDEEGIKSLIKSKENKINEAYVAVYISENDILAIQEEKRPFDKFGKPLLSLKDRSLNLDNVSRFEHLSGTYNYIRGRLVKTTPD